MEAEKYNCMVVDDEPIARSIVISYIEQMPLLKFGTEQINALNAIDYLRTHNGTDIIFLDINMPNLTGLQMLKIAQPKQPVILTTAYAEYAVESYELNVVDYLLKPFSFERFTKAVYKAVDVIRKSGAPSGENPVEKGQVIFIKSAGKNYPVRMDDILYCEAMKNYTVVVLKSGQKLNPLVSLAKFGSMLTESGGNFIQVHRSFLISRKHIGSVAAHTVTIDKFEIPIGEQFKENFFKEIGMKG